jgi:hypothetical protein
MVALNHTGRRIGEDHPRAKLSNAQVDELLELHDEQGWGYRRLAKKFGISRGHARDIINGRRRGQFPDHYKSIKAL